MNINILGYTITIEKTVANTWQKRLIKKAIIIGKNAGYKLTGDSWKIERIKAIRLIHYPYPSGYGDYYEAGKSTLTAAKNFVEQYWFE